MPSLAYGGKSCSLKFKAEVQESYLQGKQRGPNQSPGYAPAVSSWSAGLKVVRCIGYDDGAKDARRIGKSEDQRYIYVYPLREYHMDRLMHGHDPRGRFAPADKISVLYVPGLETHGLNLATCQPSRPFHYLTQDRRNLATKV